MKKAILLSILFISCSVDKEEPSCNCDKLYQKQTLVYSNGHLVSDTGWIPVGVVLEQTDIKDCSRNNEVVFSTTQSNATTIVNYRHILNCK